MLKSKIAVFVSGGGTNLQALLDAQDSGIIKSGEIVLVISNVNGAYALERAKNHGVDSVVITKKECGSQEAFEQALKDKLNEYGIDLIVLAGFMSILSENFTKCYPEMFIRHLFRHSAVRAFTDLKFMKRLWNTALRLRVQQYIL